MNKKVIISGVMMLVLLASCGGKDIDTSSDAPVSVETSTPGDASIGASIDEPVVLAQGFVEYDESYVGETKDTVLFFHQESCGSCKTMEANLIESGAGRDLTVLKVDFDASENDELRQKYGVTMKHTFVQVDSNGEMIKKWSGSLKVEDIREQIGGDAMMKDDAMMKGKEPIEAEEVMTKELTGIYTDYDSSLVGETEDTVLFFHASWCPSCSAADKGIKSGSVPEGLSILKTDFDTSTDLRKKYGVVAQHTFVQIDADGNEIKKWVGGNSVEDIVERVQ